MDYLFYFQAKRKSPAKNFEIKSEKKKKMVTEQAHQEEKKKNKKPNINP